MRHQKNILILGLSALLIFFIFSDVSAASPITPEAWGDIAAQNETLIDNSGFEEVAEEGLGNVVAGIIKVFLSLLGIIFIFLIVTAGYKYMTADGDEAKVEEALERIKTAVIGLIIIVSAYAITAFVFKNAPSGGGGASQNQLAPQ
jgi:hypothetical protein